MSKSHEPHDEQDGPCPTCGHAPKARKKGQVKTLVLVGGAGLVAWLLWKKSKEDERRERALERADERLALMEAERAPLAQPAPYAMPALYPAPPPLRW